MVLPSSVRKWIAAVISKTLKRLCRMRKETIGKPTDAGSARCEKRCIAGIIVDWLDSPRCNQRRFREADASSTSQFEPN